MSTAPNPWTPGDTPPMPERAPAVPPPLIVKKPGFAAFLSAFPGLGNVYNGLYLRGLIFFVIIFTLVGIVSSLDGSSQGAAVFFGPAIAFFWLFNMIDAYRQAVLINHGYQQDLGLLDLPKRLRPGQGGIAAGVILVLIGVYALLERFANVQLDWIFDLWPLLAVGLGVWLIWGTIRDRRDPTV
jgi:hypothetical protein